MISKPDKNKIRQKRHRRVRGKLSGTADRPTKTEQAVVVGKLVAERAVAKGISEVVFDRGGYLYHGRVKALADAARENGLKF